MPRGEPKLVSATGARRLGWLESPWWRATLPDAVSVVLFIVLATLVFTTYDDSAIGWDEPVHLDYGDHIIRWYETGGSDDTALHFRRDYLYRGGFDALGKVSLNSEPFALRVLLTGYNRSAQPLRCRGIRRE